MRIANWKFYLAILCHLSATELCSAAASRHIIKRGLQLYHATPISQVLPILRSGKLDIQQAHRWDKSPYEHRKSVYLSLSSKQSLKSFVHQHKLDLAHLPYAVFVYKPTVFDTLKSFHMTNSHVFGKFISSPMTKPSIDLLTSVSSTNPDDVVDMIELIAISDMNNEIVVNHSVPTNEHTLQHLYYPSSDEEASLLEESMPHIPFDIQ